MRLKRIWLFVVFCLSAQISLSAKALQTMEGYQKELKPFFNQYCIGCHGPKKEKGGFRVDHLPTTIHNETDAEAWQDLLDVLNIDEMPPEDEKQPKVGELANVIEKITTNLFEARKKLIDTSFITMGKLNKREYLNTLQSLLGVSVDVEGLTEDGTLEGFDTIGVAQSLSDIDFETYLKLGEQALLKAVDTKEGLKVSKTFQPEVNVNESISKQLRTQKKNVVNAIKLLEKSPKDERTLKRKKSSEQLIRNGEKYLSFSESRKGYIMGLEQKSSYRNNYFITIYPSQENLPKRFADKNLQLGSGIYKATIKAGIINGKHLDHAVFVDTELSNFSKGTEAYTKPIETRQLFGNTKSPKSFEVTFKYEAAQKEYFNIKLSELTEKYYSHKGRYKKKPGQENGYPWIESVHIEGPITREKTPLQSFLKQELGHLKNHRSPLKLFKEFAYHAYRQKLPSETFFTQLEQHYQLLIKDGLSTQDAAIKCLAVILASPKFLFKHEISSEKEDNYRQIDDLDFAIRLAYFLWSSPPDQKLYSLANQNKLRDPKVLRPEIDRMLNHSKAMSFYTNFTSQWLGLDALDMIVANEQKFPHFNDTLRRNFKQETIHFFKELVLSNLKADNFIHSDFIVVNNALAHYYNIKAKPLNGFETLPISKNSHRGGLLGQASILTMTGTGERTSPVLRGVFVYDKILGYPVPPPPPNVPQFDEENKSSTVRQTLDLHKTQAQCASCHSRIDPLGFALENFDAVGVWREKEAITQPNKKKKDLVQIDASGVIPGNKAKFSSFSTFKNQLLNEKDRVAQSVSKAMITYALGRRVGFSDGIFLDTFLEKWKSQDYKMRELIYLIIQSKAFNQK